MARPAQYYVATGKTLILELVTNELAVTRPELEAFGVATIEVVLGVERVFDGRGRQEAAAHGVVRCHGVTGACDTRPASSA
jgi:hypothetical protein